MSSNKRRPTSMTTDRRNSMNVRKSLLAIGLLAMLAAGCAFPSDAGTPPPQIQTWIDAPLDGSTIPLAPYTFVVSASIYPGGVDDFELWVNGVLEETVAVMFLSAGGPSKYAYSEYEWTPPAPGSYLLEARGLNSQGSGPLAQAQFNVAGVEFVAEPPTDELPEEENSDNGEALPGPIRFDTAMFYYGRGCTPQQVMVEFMIADPDIFNVVLFMRLEDLGSGEKTDWTAVSMNAIGNDYYGRTVASDQIPDAAMFKEAYFQVQIVVTGPDGSEITRTEVVRDQVVLLACGEAPPPDEGPTATTEPPTATPVPTQTPIPPPK